MTREDEMSRTIKDAELGTREARGRLMAKRNQEAKEASKKRGVPVEPDHSRPHYRMLVPGELHLGYVRTRQDAPGHWTVRRHVGNSAGGSPYRVERLPGVADDFQRRTASGR